MTSRRRLLSTALPVPAALLAACAPGAPCGGQPAASGPAAPKGPVTVTWLAWAGAGSETEQYQLNASEFTKLQPQITVDWVNTNTLDDNLAKFMTMAAAGTPPNVVQVHYSNGVDLASRGTLAPLDALMARDRVRKEDFLPGLADEFAWKKTQYGLPKDNALRVMYLNLDLFD